MLTFSPGQLSTLVGGNINPFDFGNFTTSAFNFADLPCPPRSVMVRLVTDL
jgi:hypothetical protein